MAADWTRRSFLISAVAAAGRGRRFPSERVRLVDRATEFPLFRLTDPKHASHLPSCSLRAVSKRRGFLLFTSERTGSAQPFRADLATGELEQLAEAREFDGGTLGLLADDRGCCYFDGPSLMRLAFGSAGGREVYRVSGGWERSGGLSLSADGAFALFAERGRAGSRIRRVRLRDGAAATVVEGAGTLRDPLPRPGSGDVAYRREESGGLWLSGIEKPLAEGATGPAFWSADGASLIYLSLAARAIREVDLKSGAARDIVPATSFVCFAPNRNASVFAGASGSKAAPYIVLVLRVNRKELPVCEHGASDPAGVAPAFSPDSQCLFFESDRDGRAAIYYVPLERVVEAT
jgi:oligogalacturonide lyase